MPACQIGTCRECACQLVCLHENFTPTERTRAAASRIAAATTGELIYRILDEAFVATIGFIAGWHAICGPYKLRAVGDQLFLHGSVPSRLMKTSVAEHLFV